MQALQHIILGGILEVKARVKAKQKGLVLGTVYFCGVTGKLLECLVSTSRYDCSPVFTTNLLLLGPFQAGWSFFLEYLE